MALSIKHKDKEFGVGDIVRVVQKVKDGDKTRKQVFEGMVIGIKGREENKSFTIRRIGAQQVGIERIFPINTPTIDEVEVVKEGKRGVRKAKLYFTREKSKKAIDEIYQRADKRGKTQKAKPAKKKAAKKTTKKKVKKSSKKK
jgi:large subunit ribosomal protein L19